MSTENQVISVVLIYNLQFELHLEAEIGLLCSILQYWEAIVCFNLKNYIQIVCLWSQNVNISMSWYKFAGKPLLVLCWHKIEILFCLQMSGLYCSIQQEDQYTSWPPSTHWATGHIWAPADTHPPSFPSHKLSWILSEASCRWLLILVVSTWRLSWCVWDRKSHLSHTMSSGFWWVSEQPWTCCAGEEAAEQLRGFRCICEKEWGTGNTGHFGEIFLLVLQWGCRLLYHRVS